MTTALEDILSITADLREYAFKHTYTDDESDSLNELLYRLTALGVRVEDETKQLKRTAGGLSNKIRAMEGETKRLEGRLEELETENQDLQDYVKNQNSPAARMAAGYQNYFEDDGK